MASWISIYDHLEMNLLSDGIRGDPEWPGLGSGGFRAANQFLARRRRRRVGDYWCSQRHRGRNTANADLQAANNREEEWCKQAHVIKAKSG